VTHVSKFLHVPRLDSIKSRILALAVIGTLLPAGIMLGVAYRQNRNALQAKITDDLVAESNQTARGIGVWLKERLYDLRVFASSDEVATNLARYSTQGTPSPRLRDYLRRVHERFPDFEQILVLDANGRMLATSAPHAHPVRLPADWQRTLRTSGQVVSEAYWDGETEKGEILMALPVHRADGTLLGAFAAEISLAPVQKTLREFARDTASNGVYLASDSGHVLATANEISQRLLGMRLDPATLRRLAQRENATASFVNFEGREVVGTLKKVPQTRWNVISELPSDQAFAQLLRFKNVALLVGALVLLIVAATAYRLGILIVRPLERLADGASQVARGGLDVDLPAVGTGEVGELTKVFNQMVQRLREGREELERLSVTDGLTGLVNHRALMQRLNEEGTRSLRSKRAFTVIMCDVDHFKQYNDEFGHPEGDQVLKQVASLLKESTRTVDCAARYGGEEFAVLLPETDMSGAVEVAERIRARVENGDFPGRKITVSIGVAEFPKHGRIPQDVVAVADAALYEAKRGGRNQVARGSTAKEKKLPASRALKRAAAARKRD
jgi:diguanylate cyclase (GGDEF)-like protein